MKVVLFAVALALAVTLVAAGDGMNVCGRPNVVCECDEIEVEADCRNAVYENLEEGSNFDCIYFPCAWVPSQSGNGRNVCRSKPDGGDDYKPGNPDNEGADSNYHDNGCFRGDCLLECEVEGELSEDLGDMEVTTRASRRA